MDEQLTESTGWADFRSRSTTDDVDPWAWTEQRSAEPPEVDLSHERVTAVLVTLDAEEWLPDTLAGLARLEPPPTRLIAIDNASTDSTRALLQRAHDQGLLDAVYDGERGFGFGAAVSAALAADRKRAPAERGSDRGTRWLWLLHDDAVPAPDALRALLSHAVTDPSHRCHRAQAAAPASSPHRAPAERDRHQHLGHGTARTDARGRRDRPGTTRSASGATRRLDLRDAAQGRGVQGPEGLRPGRADLPRRPRVRLAGAPARLPGRHHAERPDESPTGRSCRTPTGRRCRSRDPGKVDRELGMVVVAGHASPARLPLVWLRLVWSSSAARHRLPAGQGARPGPGRDGGPGLLPGPSRSGACLPAAAPRPRGGAWCAARWSRRCDRPGGRACGSPRRPSPVRCRIGTAPSRARSRSPRWTN